MRRLALEAARVLEHSAAVAHFVDALGTCGIALAGVGDTSGLDRVRDSRSRLWTLTILALAGALVGGLGVLLLL